MEFRFPKIFFPHTVTYTSTEQSYDSYGYLVPSEPKAVTGVRISANTSINHEVRNSADDSRAVLYVSPYYSSFTDFELQGKIEYQGQEYVIQYIHRHSQPNSNNVHHWRLELV